MVSELSWTESTEATLESYGLRIVPGSEYSSDDESTLASIPAGSPFTYTSSAGFGLPGNAVSYKIYVRLIIGNEAGSDPVTVTRPL